MHKITKLLDYTCLVAVLISATTLHDNPWSGQIYVLLGAFAVMILVRLAVAALTAYINKLKQLLLALAMSSGLAVAQLSDRFPARIQLLVPDQKILLGLLLLSCSLIFVSFNQVTKYLVETYKSRKLLIQALSLLFSSATLWLLLTTAQKLDLFRSANVGNKFTVVLVWTVIGLGMRWVLGAFASSKESRLEWVPIVGYLLALILIA
jgi:hypothetical protein